MMDLVPLAVIACIAGVLGALLIFVANRDR